MTLEAMILFAGISVCTGASIFYLFFDNSGV